MRDHLSTDRPASAPAGPPRSSRGLVFRLYTSNPFYIISADLMFVGLRMSFDTHGQAFETWGLMLGLAGYTLLLATTACLLIRYGRVWDDVRSILLLVVLMFLAMSVTFDDTLARRPGLGASCFLGGLAFAVLVSEGVLRGIRLALPAWFRLPYYAILALFFVYPIGLTPLLRDPENRALQWALFGFSPMAGLVFLTLLPAIRRGPRYVDHNGSPWRWPLYPWVLFGILGLAVCARSSYLCVSLHFVDRTLREGTNSIFGAYFLVPFLFAVALLVLEIGLVGRHRGVVRAAMAAPLGLVALSVVGHRPDAVYQRFLALFLGDLGASPFYLTLVGASAFYALAAWRGVALAPAALAASLASLSVVGPVTIDLDGLVAPRSWPLAAVAALEAWRALRRRESWRSLVAAACLVAAVAVALPDEWSTTARRLVTAHLALAAVLAVGALFDDALARWLQGAGALGLLLATSASVFVRPEGLVGVPAELLPAYPFVALAVAIGYGSLVGNRLFFAGAAMATAAWLGAEGWRGYLGLRRVVAGLDHIAWGLAFFVVAALISLAKAGVFAKRPQWRWPDREL